MRWLVELVGSGRLTRTARAFIRRQLFRVASGQNKAEENPMVSLQKQKDFRSVQSLPFCYLCGNAFAPGDKRNRDHLPAKSLFAKQHREPSLWLPTHIDCNNSHELIDEKIGQLIGLRQGRRPDPLRLRVTANEMVGLVHNLDIDSAVWRWISGFHAALYRTSPVDIIRGSLVTPFPRWRDTNDFEPFRQRPQHQKFVQTLHQNRAKGTLDRITCNKEMVVYESVWCQGSLPGGSQPWLCIFGLDVCDWKDLGRTGFLPARGCAGFYVLPDQAVPAGATKGTISSIVTPMTDPLDPFSRQ
jgi:hypothetical protein